MNPVRALTETLRWLLLAALVAVLGACATVGSGAAAVPGAGLSAATAVDPWESFNRKVYAFNDAVDEAILKPVATAYRDVVPQIVRTGVSNVLGNIGDIWSAANHLLQGKLQDGLEMGMRVVTNTFFGLGGLLDPATELGLTRRSEDFGQTLGRWGVGTGPYLVLPFLGPSTVRDSAGLAVDRSIDSQMLPLSSGERYGLTALELVSIRAGLLGATKLLDEVALDRYSFLRDAYLARRRDAVYDGAAPMERFEDDAADAPAKPASAPR
ncbi:MAG: VacJ family lipoprotein [Rubrivivax sp.]|nr:VacJ family lipoprotein [Rubrivivax sp.]